MHRGPLYITRLPLGHCICPAACGRDISWNAGAGYISPEFHNLKPQSTHDQGYGCGSSRHGCFTEGYHTAAHVGILDQSC